MNGTATGGLHHGVSGAGPPIVFVHGVGGSVDLWADVTQRLGARHRCVAVDLVGFGRSPALPEESWNVADWGRSVRSFLDGLEEGPVVPVGHSLGGMVVQELLLADASGVRAAVLCNTIPGATEQVVAINEALAEMASGQGSAALAEAMVPGLVGPGPLEATERARGLTRAAMAGSPASSLARSLRAICAFDAVERLGDLALPVLVVAGEHEGNLEDQRRLAEALPDATLVVMAGAGHMAPMEAPTQFATIVEDFLLRSSQEDTAP